MLNIIYVLLNTHEIQYINILKIMKNYTNYKYILLLKS